MLEKLKRSKEQRELDYSAISKLFVDGKNPKEISLELNLPEHIVRADIRKLKSAWEKENVTNLNLLKNVQNARLEYVIREAQEAWELSKKSGKKTSLKVQTVRFDTTVNPATGQNVTTAVPARMRTEELEEIIPGDVKYLEAFLGGIREQAKLNGTYAPKTIQHTGENPEDTASRVASAREELLSKIEAVIKNTVDNKKFSEGEQIVIDAVIIEDAEPQKQLTEGSNDS